MGDSGWPVNGPSWTLIPKTGTKVGDGMLSAVALCQATGTEVGDGKASHRPSYYRQPTVSPGIDIHRGCC